MHLPKGRQAVLSCVFSKSNRYLKYEIVNLFTMNITLDFKNIVLLCRALLFQEHTLSIAWSIVGASNFCIKVVQTFQNHPWNPHSSIRGICENHPSLFESYSPLEYCCWLCAPIYGHCLPSYIMTASSLIKCHVTGQMSTLTVSMNMTKSSVHFNHLPRNQT